MMENNKITHIDWKAIEETFGKFLTQDQVCQILRISEYDLRDYNGRGILSPIYDSVNKRSVHDIIKVKNFAEIWFDIKDGSYIHDDEKKEEDFFTSICNTITQRIAAAKEIAEKNGNECGLSYLVGCFDLTTNSIRNYIQTHQEEYKEEYKEENIVGDSLSRKEVNNAS